MKKLFIYTLLFLAPFLFVVLVNESTKPNDIFVVKLNLTGKPKVAAYNSGSFLPNKCSWDCHNHGCKHNEKNKINVGFVSTIYNSIISFNNLPSKNGVDGLNYQFMNIIFLVVLWPLVLFGLVILNVNQLVRKND
jgi:hypothetical protein